MLALGTVFFYFYFVILLKNPKYIGEHIPESLQFHRPKKICLNKNWTRQRNIEIVHKQSTKRTNEWTMRLYRRNERRMLNVCLARNAFMTLFLWGSPLSNTHTHTLHNLRYNEHWKVSLNMQKHKNSCGEVLSGCGYDSRFRNFSETIANWKYNISWDRNTKQRVFQ